MSPLPRTDCGDRRRGRSPRNRPFNGRASPEASSRLNLALSTMPETCDNSSLRSFPGIPGPATTQPCTQMAPSQKLRPGGRPESHRRTRGGPRPRRPVAQACLGRPSSRHAVGRHPCRPARAASPATSMSWRPNWAASPSTACAIATGWTSKTTHSRPRWDWRGRGHGRRNSTRTRRPTCALHPPRPPTPVAVKHRESPRSGSGVPAGRHPRCRREPGALRGGCRLTDAAARSVRDA